jgi:VanZ family protein
MNKKIWLISSIIALILYSALIIVLTLISVKDVQKVMLFPFQDKIVHIGMFLVWGFLLALILHYSDNFSKTVYFLSGGALFSAVDELLQFLSSGRSVEFADWASDIFGISLGLLALYFILKIRGVNRDAS